MLAEFDKGEIKQVALWLRNGMNIGANRVNENPLRWLHRSRSDGYEACALGFVLIGKINDIESTFRVYEETRAGQTSFDSHRRTMIGLTEIQPELLDLIHAVHYYQRIPALTIHRYLDQA
jgi:hypothetical protein